MDGLSRKDPGVGGLVIRRFLPDPCFAEFCESSRRTASLRACTRRVSATWISVFATSHRHAHRQRRRPDLPGMPLGAITIDTMRTAFAQYPASRAAASIQRRGSSRNVLCTTARAFRRGDQVRDHGRPLGSQEAKTPSDQFRPMGRLTEDHLTSTGFGATGCSSRLNHPGRDLELPRVLPQRRSARPRTRAARA